LVCCCPRLLSRANSVLSAAAASSRPRRCIRKSGNGRLNLRGSRLRRVLLPLPALVERLRERNPVGSLPAATNHRLLTPSPPPLSSSSLCCADAVSNNSTDSLLVLECGAWRASIDSKARLWSRVVSQSVSQSVWCSSSHADGRPELPERRTGPPPSAPPSSAPPPAGAASSLLWRRPSERWGRRGRPAAAPVQQDELVVVLGPQCQQSARPSPPRLCAPSPPPPVPVVGIRDPRRGPDHRHQPARRADAIEVAPRHGGAVPHVDRRIAILRTAAATAAAAAGAPAAVRGGRRHAGESVFGSGCRRGGRQGVPEGRRRGRAFGRSTFVVLLRGKGLQAAPALSQRRWRCRRTAGREH
jgi:hypothetical protein